MSELDDVNLTPEIISTLSFTRIGELIEAGKIGTPDLADAAMQAINTITAEGLIQAGNPDLGEQHRILTASLQMRLLQAETLKSHYDNLETGLGENQNNLTHEEISRRAEGWNTLVSALRQKLPEE